MQAVKIPERACFHAILLYNKGWVFFASLRLVFQARRKGVIMAGIVQSIASLFAAGTLLLTDAVDTATPQNNDEGLLFLVNRQWRISENYTPPLRMTDVPGQVRRLRPDASAALEEMYAACKEEIGVTLTSVSGYRSYTKQTNIYNAKLKRVNGSRERADEYVARPGASEHHLGLAMDVGQKSKTNLTAAFGNTQGGKWVRENCWRFGFILRYEEDWEDITGYKFEPWHVRYVGKENAAKLHENPMPLETYLQILRESVLIDLVAEEE